LAWRDLLGVKAELMTPIELQLIQHSINEIGAAFPHGSLQRSANNTLVRLTAFESQHRTRSDQPDRPITGRKGR
ncbi:MAG: hypothetical protein QM706_07755, partial [Nitrospira sp.]